MRTMNYSKDNLYSAYANSKAISLIVLSPVSKCFFMYGASTIHLSRLSTGFGSITTLLSWKQPDKSKSKIKSVFFICSIIPIFNNFVNIILWK